MLKRVELQHKVKCFEEEYNVILDEGSDFSTAYETLQWVFGNSKKSENIIIPMDSGDYVNIFKKDGERNIYFYSDEKDEEPRRKEFVDTIISKHPSSDIYIFVCASEELDLFTVNKICTEIVGENTQNSYIHVTIDSNRHNNSVRIVIGA